MLIQCVPHFWWKTSFHLHSHTAPSISSNPSLSWGLCVQLLCWYLSVSQQIIQIKMCQNKMWSVCFYINHIINPSMVSSDRPHPLVPIIKVLHFPMLRSNSHCSECLEVLLLRTNAFDTLLHNDSFRFECAVYCTYIAFSLCVHTGKTCSKDRFTGKHQTEGLWIQEILLYI